MSGLFGSGQTASEPARISSLRIQNSSYGAAVTVVLGRQRTTGNLLWYGDLNAIRHEEKQEGGKGGDTPSSVSYGYRYSMQVGICEGPIHSCGEVWMMNGSDKLRLSQNTQYGYAIYPGTTPNLNSSILKQRHAGQFFEYPGLCHFTAVDLGEFSGDTPPNFSYEICGQAYDPQLRGADPAHAIDLIIRNARWGASAPQNRFPLACEYSNYAVAMGFILGLELAEQKPASDWINDILIQTNAEAVWAADHLQIIPYGDEAVSGNGRNWTPNCTPVVDLSDEDFLGEAASPIRVTRKADSETFNIVPIEFRNEANEYNKETIEGSDAASVAMFGAKKMSDTIAAHGIVSASAAGRLANLIVQRKLLTRNEFEFTLPWTFSYLLPMDIVTLSEESLGLQHYPVRISKVVESADWSITCTAVDFPAGAGHAALIERQTSEGYSKDFNRDPGNALAPFFFEPPIQLAGQTGIEVWFATGSGSPDWGGAQVWASYDDQHYKLIGETRHQSRIARLTSPLAGDDKSLYLELENGAAISSGSTQAANQGETLLYLGGEWLSYENATLLGNKRYRLDGLRRGLYNSPIQPDQPVNQRIVRIDGTEFHGEALQSSMLGQTLFIKLVSFNLFGGGLQAIESVPAYAYRIEGRALNLAPGNVTNLVDFFRAGNLVLCWDAVSDPRRIQYEIRKGSSWKTAQVLGRIEALEFTSDGDGCYWVAACAGNAYSSQPANLLIQGATLVSNVIASSNEEALGWTGQCSGNAVCIGDAIVLGGKQRFGSIARVGEITTLRFLGGIAEEGFYTPAQEVDIGKAQACSVSVSYRARADNPFILFSQLPSLAHCSSLAGNYAGLADVRIQIAIAPDSGIYGEWRDFVPGGYIGRKFRFRARLTSHDPSVCAVLDSLITTVDMPDRIEKGTHVSIPADGMQIVYATPFQIHPNVQITLLNALQGDDVILSEQTCTSFKVQVIQAGQPVSRNLNWIAQAY